MKNTRTSATAAITEEKERITTRLSKIQAEAQALNSRLEGIAIAEQYLAGVPKTTKINPSVDVGSSTPKRGRGRPPVTKTDAPTKRPRGKSEPSLSTLTLEAVGVRAGQTVQEITGYINNRYKLGAQGNHVGASLAKHAKYGRLEFSGEKKSRTYHMPSTIPQALAS